MPLWRARLIKERSGSLLMPTCFMILINSYFSGLVLMARTPEHQPILMELSLKALMLVIGLSMVLKLSGDSNKVAASKALDDINL